MPSFQLGMSPLAPGHTPALGFEARNVLTCFFAGQKQLFICNLDVSRVNCSMHCGHELGGVDTNRTCFRGCAGHLGVLWHLEWLLPQ